MKLPTNFRIMHLRQQHPKGGFDQKARGITLLHGLTDEGMIVFKWAINNPNDEYVKSIGIHEAVNNDAMIGVDYDPNIPVKYQFHNAIAEIRRDQLSVFGKATDFINLTFVGLASISQVNGWYTPEALDQLKYVHPDITLNYIHRCHKSLEQ